MSPACAAAAAPSRLAQRNRFMAWSPVRGGGPHRSAWRSAHPAQRGNAVVHIVEEFVAARLEHDAAAAEVGVLAQFPAAFVDDDGTGLVVEVVAVQGAHLVVVQLQPGAAESRLGKQHDGFAALAVAAVVVAVATAAA